MLQHMLPYGAAIITGLVAGEKMQHLIHSYDI
jgi:hypothetical protein